MRYIFLLVLSDVIGGQRWYLAESTNSACAVPGQGQDRRLCLAMAMVHSCLDDGKDILRVAFSCGGRQLLPLRCAQVLTPLVGEGVRRDGASFLRLLLSGPERVHQAHSCDIHPACEVMDGRHGFNLQLLLAVLSPGLKLFLQELLHVFEAFEVVASQDWQQLPKEVINILVRVTFGQVGARNCAHLAAPDQQSTVQVGTGVLRLGCCVIRLQPQMGRELPRRGCNRV